MLLGNQYFPEETLLLGSWAELVESGISEFDRYKLIQGHFTPGILDLLPANIKSMVFLREPVARTISHLKHLRRDPNFHPAHHLAVGRSLDDLVQDDQVMSLCSNVQTAILSNDTPGKTILAGLRREQELGRPLDAGVFQTPVDFEKADRMLRRFDFVGFVEDFENDALRASMQFGFHPPDTLPKRNYDPEDNVAASLAPETLRRLRTRNALDIALYERARATFGRTFALTRDDILGSLASRGVYAPIHEPTEIPIAGPIPGSNWYEAETPETGDMRWTGPLPETALDLPLASGFDFEISMFIRIENLADLTVAAYGQDLPITCLSVDGRMHRISFWVPARLIHAEGLTTVRFTTRTVFQGSETDIRQLSFLVRELAVSAAVPAASP